MDLIRNSISNITSNNHTGVRNAGSAAQNNSQQAPVDKFESSSSAQTPAPEYKKGESLLVKLMNVPIPTTVPKISAAQVEEIKSKIKPGDIILETDHRYPGLQILEKIAAGSDFSHAAYYVGDNKLIEANCCEPSGVGVTEKTLDEFLAYNQSIEIIRPNYKSEEDVKAGVNYAYKQLGKPYDSYLNSKNDDELYCSELVWRALNAGENKMEVPSMNYLGVAEVVPPNAFQQMEGASVVFSTGCDIMKSLASYYPIYLSAIAGAAAGAALAGPVGAAQGLAAGSIAAIAVGDVVQSGHDLKELITTRLGMNKPEAEK
ncbi:MAG: hypothetical protein LWY06_12635 [Firmicutes bacterium]|nr:hypothetical protein [Bacillota bacterium]